MQKGPSILSFLAVILVSFMSFTNASSYIPVPESPSSSGGGGTIPIINIEITYQGDNYEMGTTRLKFEFEEQLYALQLRKINEDYVLFLVMTLDMNNPDDITAFTIDDSFNLSINETREIDIDKDGTKNIFLQLNDITPIGESGSVNSADFFIKRITISEIIEDNESFKDKVENKDKQFDEDEKWQDESFEDKIIEKNLANSSVENSKIIVLSNKSLNLKDNKNLFEKFYDWLSNIF